MALADFSYRWGWTLPFVLEALSSLFGFPLAFHGFPMLPFNLDYPQAKQTWAQHPGPGTDSAVLARVPSMYYESTSLIQ